MQNWKDKKVLVMGLGIQGGGVGVARYFAQIGSIVTVTDLKSENDLQPSIDILKKYPNVSFRLGGHCEEDFLNADLIVKGPSVRWDNIYIMDAIKHGIRVIMETAYFALHTKAKVVGITGTRGKSTTTTLIYDTLNKFYTGGKVYLAGNVPGTCAIELLNVAKSNDIVVLELSSWQLAGFHRIKVSPEIAVFTTIYEDHLNYYNHMQKYIYDKAAIFLYQKPKDHFVTYTKTYDILQYYKIAIPAIIHQYSSHDFPAELAYIRGVHNKLNAALALGACKQILQQTDDQDIIKFISNSKGLRFRQQVVAHTEKVTIINDSTSTTPIATLTALHTFQDKPIVLILGGSSKKLSLTDLVNGIEKNVTNIRKIYLIKGEMTEEILPLLSKIKHLNTSEIIDNFKLAVQEAFDTCSQLNESNYLLFSPGAPSFAQFKNEFDRGETFDKVVSDIMKK